MPRHSLKTIDELMGPQRVNRAKGRAAAKLEQLLLRDVRQQLGLTQLKLAKKLGVSQSALSQLESQDDMQLSTLRKVVKAMGGELSIVLRFGDRETVLKAR